jgi:curved DNA-binding protein CbpA
MKGQQPDYYAVLGVRRDVSAAEIDRAYRRAARATHPDVHPHDRSAAERFRAATVAYETLRDPARRASYDRAHPFVRSNAPARIVVRRREPPVEGDLLELAEAISRVLGRWPFR